MFALPTGAGFTLPGLLGPGVDVKVNGYIVVEPSIHPSGKRYEWEASSSPLDGIAPPALPDWLRSLRVELKHPGAGVRPVDPITARDVREALYVLDADSYDTWVRAGMALHATGWGQGAYGIWCAWAQESDKFNPTASREKWASFNSDRAAGGLSIAWIFQQAQDNGWANPAARVGRAPEAVPEEPPPTPHPNGEAAQEQQTAPMLTIAQLRESAKNVSWLVKHSIPMSSIGLLFGAYETFKSFIALDLALHVAHGMKWLGRRTKKGPVIYIAAEGGVGFWRRVDAWHRHHGILADSAQLYTVPAAVDLSNDAALVYEAASKLNVTPALVVVDTVSQTMAGEENSATEVASYLREIGLRFRLTWQCCVLAVHHVGHVETERPRGSSAISGNVDFMLSVARDEKEMLATLSNPRQKDGERQKPESFAMTVVELGTDEDGDAITSVVAGVLPKAELADAMRYEAERGRGGRNHLFLDLAFNGLEEQKLRTLFCDAVDGDPEKKRQAYHRARKWATAAGILDIKDGYVVRLGA